MDLAEGLVMLCEVPSELQGTAENLADARAFEVRPQSRVSRTDSGVVAYAMHGVQM